MGVIDIRPGWRRERLITRKEIVEVVGHAFSAGATDRQLIAIARCAGADDQIVDLLRRLPERTYEHIGELWTHLPELPAGH